MKEILTRSDIRNYAMGIAGLTLVGAAVWLEYRRREDDRLYHDAMPRLPRADRKYLYDHDAIMRLSRA